MEIKTTNFIDFIITQKCTYRCPYCLQSKSCTKDYQDASDETIDSFLNFLDTTDKTFEITITGGEAILHPRFFEIIKSIKSKGFKINLITNLSFKIETYQKIFDCLDDSLNRFDISFHLDEIQSFNLAVEKLNKFLNFRPKSTKTTFFIPLYDLDSKKELKIDSLIRIAKRHNIEYSFQKIRVLGKYKEIENEKYHSSHKKHKTFASLCHAGARSAVIYEDGSVYRCYSSRFLKSNYLGNIKDENFKLNNDKTPCVSCFCACPKPKNNNQITDEKDYDTASKTALKNAVFLPVLMFKNRKIIFAKAKQFLKV